MSKPPSPWRLLIAASLLAAVPAFAADPGSAPGQDPVSVMVAVTARDAGALVVLSFSRRVEYRLDETRSRLRVIVAAPIAEASQFDRDVDGDVLKRIRFDESSRGSEIIFHLGREFDNFTTSELENPFRLQLGFQRRGAAPLALREEPKQAPQAASPPGSAAGQEPGAQPLDRAGEAGEPPPRQPGEVRNIVIDPGHGGEEEGAISSSGLKEKELVLDIARQLKARLEQGGYVVALTRDEDQAVDLTERSAIANHFGADLFLSIHANSSRRGAARGAETFFLAYSATDEETRSLARSENRPGGGEGDSAGEIDLVLWEMAQAEHLSRSSRLADLVQAEMNSLAGTKDRGVKQAPFRVLVGAAAPAVLVEVGFLTNQQEEKRLATQEYREKIAAALAAAIDRFRQQVRAEEGSAAAAQSSSPR